MEPLLAARQKLREMFTKLHRKLPLSTIIPTGTRAEIRKLIGMALIPFEKQRHATSKLHRD
jgi:hypothetical protein